MLEAFSCALLFINNNWKKLLFHPSLTSQIPITIFNRNSKLYNKDSIFRLIGDHRLSYLSPGLYVFGFAPIFILLVSVLLNLHSKRLMLYQKILDFFLFLGMKYNWRIKSLAFYFLFSFLDDSWYLTLISSVFWSELKRLEISLI